jgi:ORMDL family
MFHWVTGVPFQTEEHAGAYDDLTLWEQIDGGAQYTPAKKWLLVTPIALSVNFTFLRAIFLLFTSDFSSPPTTPITSLGHSLSVSLPL